MKSAIPQVLLSLIFLMGCGADVGERPAPTLKQTLGPTIFERLVTVEDYEIAVSDQSRTGTPNIGLMRQARGGLIVQNSDLTGFVPVVMSLSSDPKLDEFEYEAVFRRLCQEQREFLVEQAGIESVPKSGRFLLSFLWPEGGVEFVGFSRLIDPNTCEVVSA